MLTTLGEFPDDVVLEKPSDKAASALKDEENAALLPPYSADGPSPEIMARQMHFFVSRPRSAVEAEFMYARFSGLVGFGTVGEGEIGVGLICLLASRTLCVEKFPCCALMRERQTTH